jgi:hypothetical protein
MFLMYYVREKLKNESHYKTFFDRKEATKILKKLLRHFKLKCDYEFTKNRSGSARKLRYGGYLIKLPKEHISLGLICHELGHVRMWEKYNAAGHNKKLTGCCKPIFRYTKKFLKYDVEECWTGNDIY